MAKTKFVFDKETGTMKPEAVVEAKKQEADGTPPKSVVDAHKAEASIDLTSKKPNVELNEAIVQFRENSDYTKVQITDERTGKGMMLIAGWGLEIKFNMAELRSTQRIEELLEALKNLFRELIIQQAVSK